MKKTRCIFTAMILSFLSIFIGGCYQYGITKTPVFADAVAPSPTITDEVNPTLTDKPVDVVVNNEMSCVPSGNPYKKDTDFDKYMYSVMELPNIDITRKCTFSGHIKKGETYIHKFTKNLNFCLMPGGVFSDVPEEGWFILITDSRSRSCYGIQDGYDDLGPIITPPYRGNMYFDILGWHFRNKDNSGPNDGSVNAPQEVREFNFLFSEEDYKKIWYSTRCSQWKFPEDCTSATQYPMSHSDTILHSRAQFIINNLTLGNLVTDSHAWIEEMDFTVEVYLPDED